ncbi:hypothetical protein BE20_51795 [Sorangium cellulosum]|uniref:Uncharacterized protein n=1 Tax=Sorangium cellulosum TaxID=56 RepID=A0A150TBI9_SORCE|nr:hypothetical protein BE18_47220 [Sorangium cellulosum]KYG02059.1 hypothetical protein BE20_51795 [Sorangium cellulosum]
MTYTVVASFSLRVSLHPSISLPLSLLAAFCVLAPTVMAYAVNAWVLRRASPTLVDSRPRREGETAADEARDVRRLTAETGYVTMRPRSATRLIG